MLRIHRSTRNGPYADEDVDRLNHLLPSLSRAAQNQLNQIRVVQIEGLATAALDHLQLAVIVIDSDRSVLHVNAMAEDILADDAILMVRENRLSFGDVEADAKLQHSISGASSLYGTAWHPPVVQFRCTGTRNYEVSISPLKRRDFLGGISEAILLTLKGIDRQFEGLVAKLRKEFGLTASEAAAYH
jgi:hypothetical protein